MSAAIWWQPVMLAFMAPVLFAGAFLHGNPIPWVFAGLGIVTALVSAGIVWCNIKLQKRYSQQHSEPR